MQVKIETSIPPCMSLKGKITLAMPVRKYPGRADDFRASDSAAQDGGVQSAGGAGWAISAQSNPSADQWI